MTIRLSGFQIKILWKLHRRGKYGGSHTAAEYAVKGFRKDLGSEARDALRGLVKGGLVMEKQTAYGAQVSLNPREVETIHAVCDWYTERAGTVDERRLYEIDLG